MAKIFDLDVEDFVAESVALSADPGRVDEEMQRIPSLIAYWNAKLADATTDHLRRDLALDVVRAETRQRVQIENDGKKMTVADLDALVTLDPAVQEAHNARIEADGTARTVRGMVDAIAAKRDMLQSIGARLRLELQHDLSVRAQRAGERG
jgi:hypothetical protein